MLEINSSMNFQSQKFDQPYLDKDRTKLSIVLWKCSYKLHEH
jgi:hypothetical protein